MGLRGGRVYRLHVADEAAASKVDALLNDEALPKMKTVKGFEKACRTVCKAEWAYEVAYVFSSLEDFKAYDGSEYRQKELVPLLEKAMKLMKEPEKMYMGVRVYDESE